MQPINYMSGAQNPMQSYLEGLKFGQDIRATQEALALDEKKKLFQADLIALQEKPTGNGMLNLMMKYPDFAKSLEPIQKAYSSAEKQGELSNLMQVDNALANGNVKLALQLANNTKAALTNVGENTAQIDNIIKLVEGNDVAGAQGITGALLASVLGDKYKTYREGQTEQMTQPLKVRELEAKGKLEEAKAYGEQLKNQSTITGQKNSQLAGGLLDASTALAQGDTKSAMATLEREEAYARQLGMPTYNYALAMQYLNANDAVGAKRVLDTAGVEVYGKDWKDIVSGQTALVKQPSDILEAKSKATTAEVEAKYAPTFAELKKELEKNKNKTEILTQKNITARTNNEYKEGSIKDEQLKGVILENKKKGKELEKQINETVSYANQQYQFLDQTSSSGKELYALLKTAEKENKIDPTGVLVNKLPTFRQSTQAIEQRIERVKDQIALIKSPAYVNLFKPMSNADMQAISNAQQNLSMSNSLEDNLRALEKVDIVLKKAYKQVLQSTGVDKQTAFSYEPDVVGKKPITKQQPNPFKLK